MFYLEAQNKVEESSNVKIYFNHTLDKIEKDFLFFKNNVKYNINNNIIFGTDGFNSKVRFNIWKTTFGSNT